MQIARDWNTKDEASGHEGHVLKLEVRSEFLDRYEVRVAGDSRHREYWIQAAELDEFNRNIQGEIEVVREFLSAGQSSTLG